MMFLLSGVKQGPPGVAWGGCRGGSTPARPVGGVRGTLLALTLSEARRCVLWTRDCFSEARPPRQRSGLHPAWPLLAVAPSATPGHRSSVIVLFLR